jgi:hypothetical protein
MALEKVITEDKIEIVGEFKAVQVRTCTKVLEDGVELATFNWVISTLERDLQPADMDGAVIVAHWRCNAAQESEGTTYSASSYGTSGFTPDPTSPSYVPYSSVTEELGIILVFC